MFWFIGKSKNKLLALNSLKGTRGFSLLELIVVITIFLIITMVVIADIPNFRDKGALELTVSEVATYIRGAQVYGAAQKNKESFYVIHFTSGGSNFCLLSSAKTDCSNDFEERYEIPGFKIGRFFSGNDVFSSENIDIVFQSNDYSATIGTKLEPSFYYDYNNLNIANIPNYLGVEIVSVRDSSLSYCVRIYGNGQITPAQCQM